MRILYLITQSDIIGGASLHVLDLAEGMLAQGHTVKILSGGKLDSALARLAKARNIPYGALRKLVHPIRPLKDVAAVLELLAEIRAFKPDLIHLHSSKAGILGRIAATLTRTPSVFTAHGWSFTEGVSSRNRVFYRWIERTFAGFVSKIITVSQYDNDLAVREGIARREKIITVHNGVPDHLLKKDYEAGHDNDDDHVVKLIMVARFQPQKSQLKLLKSLSEIPHLNWRLELIGDGPRLRECEEFCRDNSMATKVLFSGVRDDVAQRLAAADVLVLISEWEGLPLSIIEGMRACLPVIASDVGGVNELVKDGENGYLIPRNDSAKLIASITNLCKDGGLRRRMGMRGREMFEASFSYAHMFEKTMSVYKDVCR